MTSQDDQMLQELFNEVKSTFSEFKGLYFFGSRAKNSYQSYSDYDIVLVFDKAIDWRFEKTVMEQVYDFELKYDVVIDLHIYNYQKVQNPSTPFLENVQNEGVFYGN